MYNTFDNWESGLCLAHHGIKGQKWGVRNYQNPDGTLTAAGRARYGAGEGGSKRMSRQYNRQVKKLNRLKSRADIETQKANAEKYNRRAKIAAGAAVGLGAAAAGSHLSTTLGRQKDYESWRRAYNEADAESSQVLDWLYKNTKADDATWNHMSGRFDRAMYRMATASHESGKLRKTMSYATSPLSTKTKVLAGATAVAAGVAVYNKARAHMAKVRTTDLGHMKAVHKVKQHVAKMEKMFANTPYADLLKQQQRRNKNQRKNG